MSKIRNRLIFLTLIVSFCTPAHAAFVWINNLTIKSYKTWWDGASTIITISFKDEGWQTTGCSASDATKSFFNYQQGAPHSGMLMQMSMVMTADMAGRKVNVQVNDSFCNGNGRTFGGLEVLPES